PVARLPQRRPGHLLRHDRGLRQSLQARRAGREPAQAGGRMVGDARRALGPRRLAVHPGSAGPARQETGVAMDKPDDVMFSPAVKAEQTRLGSRPMFEDREGKTEITDDMRQFLAVIDTFFFATASADGRPYIQHRGGPPGFLKPIGTHMLAFADFAGNRQYITLGHLKENDCAHIFIPHFATRQRVKLWGRARIVEGDLALMERLVDPSYKARPERAIA